MAPVAPGLSRQPLFWPRSSAAWGSPERPVPQTRAGAFKLEGWVRSWGCPSCPSHNPDALPGSKLLSCPARQAPRMGAPEFQPGLPGRLPPGASTASGLRSLVPSAVAGFLRVPVGCGARQSRAVVADLRAGLRRRLGSPQGARAWEPRVARASGRQACALLPPCGGRSRAALGRPCEPDLRVETPPRPATCCAPLR